jgi:hypothetical protein
MNLIRQLRFSHTAIGCLLALGLFNTSAMAAADIAAALSHPDRPSADADNDARRKPIEVLNFAGLELGMSVLELEAATTQKLSLERLALLAMSSYSTRQG